MKKYYISINQFAEFSAATEAGKKRILNQQKKPDKLLIPWYQKAKGAIKKFLGNVDNYSIIDSAITLLKEKVPANKRQEIDRNVSIQALEELKKVKLPRVLRYLKYEIITVAEKALQIRNVDIIVAPEVIIKATYKGKVVYGAVKIHISKGKPFNHNQATYVSTLIYQFLKTKIAKPSERVEPELCFCLDVFSGRLVPAPSSLKDEVQTIRKICDEVKVLW